ncbi:MAG: hypothetical protein JO154_02120 [Chitinophaga sp.]|uniref:hypothetical protein n=1 Tax=Chitinophaga sp. TaxID=1869181 RepID=UPI0025BC9053|nr:hypothetical protein [Chitinophaga sp.]MBV8251377.1 hypothetical protein [Chitinophaga sp.]
MRKIYLFVAIAFFVACTSNTNQSKMETVQSTDSNAVKQEAMAYPYTATYSSDFEIGHAKNAQTLLELYKNWDNNTLDNSRSSFADNDTMIFADGTMFAGTRDSLFVMAKKMRAPLGTVVDSIHAWIPLRSKDKKEDWVVIWTQEHSTDAKGKKTVREMQETWRFDKDGKINLMYQYAQQYPKMPTPPVNK